MKKNILYFAVPTAALLLAACSLTPPAAWQRGNLAKPIMAWDPDVVDAAARDHTYISKEAASGGASPAGGGCGCR
jgi:starvation-inducible outer membrane lipoprotein